MESEDWQTEIDEEILSELADGPRTKGAIVDATGRHRNTIYQHLKNLRAGEQIEFLHEPTKLYQIADGDHEANDSQ